MPYGYMDIKEMVQFLGLDLRRLERMAQRGEIPCQKVNNQWRFNRQEITEWLQQKMGGLSDQHLADMDAGITAHRKLKPAEQLICPLLCPESVSTNLRAKTKNSVLRELTELAVKSERVYDAESLLEALIQRENLYSTAMENGIAIPHPRRPLPYAISEPVLVVVHSARGIGYGAPDGKLTDLFFMTCSQDDHHHLHILARLCRMLNDKNLPDNLRAAQTPQEIIDLMVQCEKKLIADSNF